MTGRLDPDLEQRDRDVRRVRFDDWRAAFLSALEGSAGSDKLITKIVDDAAAIADAALKKIAERVPE